MSLSAKEIEAVSRLEGTKRYMYTIKAIADHQKIWSLRDGSGWLTTGGIEDFEDNENLFFPIWPFEEFAVIAWPASELVADHMPFRVFRDEFVPNLVTQHIQLSIFRTPLLDPLVLTAERFVSDVENYAAEWFE